MTRETIVCLLDDECVLGKDCPRAFKPTSWTDPNQEIEVYIEEPWCFEPKKPRMENINEDA